MNPFTVPLFLCVCPCSLMFPVNVCPGLAAFGNRCSPCSVRVTCGPGEAGEPRRTICQPHFPEPLDQTAGHYTRGGGLLSSGSGAAVRCCHSRRLSVARLSPGKGPAVIAAAPFGLLLNVPLIKKGASFSFKLTPLLACLAAMVYTVARVTASWSCSVSPRRELRCQQPDHERREDHEHHDPAVSRRLARSPALY